MTFNLLASMVTARTLQKSRPGILTIPPELRNMIWTLALLSDSKYCQPRSVFPSYEQRKIERINKITRQGRLPQTPPLLLVNRQIYLETNPLHYRINTFAIPFNLSTQDPSTLPHLTSPPLLSMQNYALTFIAPFSPPFFPQPELAHGLLTTPYRAFLQSLARLHTNPAKVHISLQLQPISILRESWHGEPKDEEWQRTKSIELSAGFGPAKDGDLLAEVEGVLRGEVERLHGEWAKSFGELFG